MRCDGGGILSQDAHGANPCHLHPPDKRIDKLGRGPTIYVVSFPRVLQEVKCPVTGCPEVAHSAGRIHKHFIYRHFQSKVVVVQDRVEPLPRCDLCRIQIPLGRLIKNQRTARYNKNY